MWLRVEVRGALEQWKGELILSRGEGGWERKTYHAGNASVSVDRRMKQNAARGNARNPPPHGNASSTPCLLRSCLLRPTESAARGKHSAVLRRRRTRRRGGINEGRGGGAAERRKQKETVLSKNMETWGAVNWGAGEGVGVRLIGLGGRAGWFRLRPDGRAGVVPAQTRRANWPGYILCVEYTQV